MIAPLLIVAAAVMPGKPLWTGEIAGYTLIKSSEPTLETQTLVIKDHRGRVVTSITDFHVTPLFEDEDSSIPIYRLTKDGLPTIELETWSGGAHASYTFYFWKLGPHPKCLLAYDKGNVITGGEDVEVIPPSKGHPAQIRTWYDGFAYIGGSGADFNSVIPVVLDLEGDRFVDRTAKYPEVLNKAASVAWADLVQSEGSRRPAMVLLAIADLRGTLRGAWPALKQVMVKPSYAYPWLREHKRDLLYIARGRFHRIAYPRAYSQKYYQFEAFPGEYHFDELSS